MYNEQTLIEEIKQYSIFNGKVVSLNIVAQHASYRRYWRIKLQDNNQYKTYIIMEYLNDPQKSEEVSSTISVNDPFVTIQNFLKKNDVSVPEIYKTIDNKNLLILEDLGDISLEVKLQSLPQNEWESFYKNGIDIIIKLQKINISNSIDSLIQSRKFDFNLLRWELDHFYQYGVKELGIKVSNSFEEKLFSIFDDIANTLLLASQTLVHRDFQSRNILIKKDIFYIIDFQDALIGSYVYDMVAFLADSYLNISENLQESVLNYFIKQKKIDNPDETRYFFYLQMLQRKLKDAGRFIFIDRIKKNPSFLPYFNPSLVYVMRAFKKLNNSKYNELENLVNQLYELNKV